MTDGQQMSDSQRLFAEYARNGSDAAFRELAARYLDLVYSTALRLVEGDTHRAEDVSQTVFADLARMASKLSPEVMLGGWLHRHTCFIAANTLRGERRRQCRERQAVEMNALQPDPDPNLKLLAPILDEAINELGEADRTAILLRFFEQRDFRAVGESLGSTEDAARMRVTRALEKLQLLLKRRGVTTTAAALSVLLAASAVQAAPAGLAVTVSTAAALGGTTLAASTTATATKAIAMTTLQKAVIGATLAAAVGAGVYKTVEAWTSQNPAQTAQHLKLDRTYALGEKTEFVLRLHESARLKFLDNAAGISDFLFQYDRDGLGFSYGFEGQKNRDSSTLTAEHTNDSRIISKSGGPVLMDCTTGWRREGAKARITFIARLVTDKEFKEETARREQQQLESLRRVLEWEDNQAVAPARMIIPTLDNPNLIALRTDYGLDKVVAGAADDYEQLRRLVKWVHDRWQHSGNNTPSKSDPRTILAEAAE